MKKRMNYWISGGALLCLLVVVSCKDNNQKLPQIDGFDNSDQVASDHLMAHWTFDGTLNEKISSTAPSTMVGNSFVDGVEGQALSLANGYLVYPTIDNLSGENALPSFTVSAWVNIDNNATHADEIFALTLGQTDALETDWNSGPINMYAETAKPLAYDDTLVLHSAFATYPNGPSQRLGGDNINDYGVRGTDFQTVLGTNQWVHYVVRYDGNESNIDIFANGVLVSNNNFRHRTNGNDGIGPVVIPAATQVLIGGWPNPDTGYSNSVGHDFEGQLTGKIDEVRVYNEALSDTEIGALYDLEKAGR